MAVALGRNEKLPISTNQSACLLTLDDSDGDEEAEVGVGGDGGEEGEDGRHQDPQSQHPLPPVQLGQPTPGVLEEVQGCQLSILLGPKCPTCQIASTKRLIQVSAF